MKPTKADLRPDEKACLQLRGLYEQYGYRKYKMGKFEEYSLYLEHKEFLGGDKVITFTDLDGQLLALKPDVTLSIIQNTKATKERNEKLYYIENIYRENRESHTFREINQMGLEFIGKVDDYAITEVVALAVRTLREISRDCILSLSHMDFAVTFLETLGLPEQTKFKLLRSIRNKNTDGVKKIADHVGLHPTQKEALAKLPTLYGKVPEVLEQAKKLVQNQAMDRYLQQLSQIYDALAQLGLADSIQVDFSMVNDLDYYNGIIFRGYVKAMGKHVLAGGQYDRAMALLGKKIEAIGFGLYLNDINRMSNQKAAFDVDAVILYDADVPIAAVARSVAQLQEQGLSVCAEQRLSQNLRYGKLYRLQDGVLKEEPTKC